jgi:hypothetical protein
MSVQQAASPYEFKGGYPTEDTIRRAYDDADLARAIQAYKLFYPTVAFSTCADHQVALGQPANQKAAMMSGSPRQTVFTPNSDTPYAFFVMDLSAGPIVIEVPPGPVMGAVNDGNQQWVLDFGIPGPDAGKGGKHIMLPPGYNGAAPKGFYAGRSTTNRVTVLMRALPLEGDVTGAFERIKSLKFHPLDPATPWKETEWVSISDTDADLTPLTIERTLDYWKALHTYIDREPVNEAMRLYYGELAALGIEKGKPFAPDARMAAILKRAAHMSNDQMRVQSFADRRADRKAWPDRQWEWATLRPENGTWDLPGYKDLIAREKWFYQAMVASPAMFQRKEGGGSLYWLNAHDSTGAYLSGDKTYRLRVPLPVPASLFWSMTIYDPDTRSQIQTPQGAAALRSLFELDHLPTTGEAELFFGPRQPPDAEGRWIQTLPEKGWFAYFRVYGPQRAAFDGSWKPGDPEVMA